MIERFNTAAIRGGGTTVKSAGFAVWRAFLHAPSTYAQARFMARVACAAVASRAIYTVYAFLALRPSGEEVIAELRRVKGPVTLDEAAIDQVIFERVADIFVWLSGGMTVAVVGLCAGLGIWQWRRPGTAMPLTCLCIIAFTVLVTLFGIQNEHVRAAALEPQNLILLMMKPVLVVMLFAAYRGGRFCQLYRKDTP
ncbi:hypothetical protein [Brevundimonas pishanensis]|uniref:hypothetical protein n=1 Tax=Brevundimonas pishanensis TaxID=2896315 RepID=UPI001FA719CC|nr:hypothetical protein [Brevundimonas pishanensis]